MLAFSGPDILYGQAQTQVPSGMPVGVSPDDKSLGGTAVGEGLNGFADAGLFTGTMDINIPIFSFDKSFGVSLDYNTKGVMVDEFASRVGLHWNLNYAGASIIRVVHDIPDELFMNNDSLIPIEYTVNGQYIDTFIVNNEKHIYGKIATYKEDPAQLNAVNAYKDSSCDEFIVSLNGFSFKFFIGKDLRIYTTSSQDIRVQLLQNNTPVSSISEYQLAVGGLSFLISDTRGNKYYFQPEASGMTLFKDKFQDWSEIDNVFVPSPNFTYLYGVPTKWKIEHIELANGGFIHFKYATGMDLKTKNVTGHQTMAYDNYYVRESPSSFYLGQNEIKPAEPDGPVTEIDYPGNVQVHFQYDSQHWNAKGDYFLNEIKISSGDNCKRFRFYVNQDADNKRYYLDSILQVSCDETVTEPYYHFTYNPIIYIKLPLPGNPPVYDTENAVLPRRLNSAQDLYGYYNGDSVGLAIGSSTNGISVPKHNPGSGTNYGNEREYAAEYAQAGLLTMMKNAYGEVEHLYYGPNVINSVPLATLGKIPADNNFIGTNQPDGVRIDSIVKTDTAHPGQKIKTVFLYSDGQLFMPGGYFHYPQYIDSATNNWEENIFQSYFLTPHEMVNGANHGYSSVEIKNYVNETLLSHRRITYTNMQDDLTGPDETRYFKVTGSKDYFQFPYTDKQYLRDWEFGLPLTVTDYDQNDRLIKKVINHYDFSTPDLSASSFVANTRKVKVNTGTALYSPGGYSGEFFPYYLNKKVFTDHYYPFKGKAALVSTVTQKYISDTRFIPDTVWYVYDNHNNLKRTITQDSKGDKTATELVYNYDVDGPQFVFPGQPGYTAHPGTTLYNMSDSGLEIPVSTERWKLLPATAVTDPNGGTVSQNNNRLLSAFITGYQYQDGKLWTKSLWNTQNGSPLGYTDYTGLIAGMSANPYGKILGAYNSSGPVIYFKNTSTVTLFDAKGNPLETQLQGQDQYKAMIWDTVSGQKLAEAANCRYSDIAYTSFEAGLPGSNLSANVPSVATSSAAAVTGSHAGILWLGITGTPGLAVSYTGTQDLKAGKSYVLSFWVNGMIPNIYAGSQLLPLSSANMVYTKGGWTMYLMRFTPSAAGKIKISGTAANSFIDEIRLFPADARMQSRTYEPLFGKSSETDASGRIIHYHYDKMGRRDLIFDMDGNILSKTDYHVAQ